MEGESSERVGDLTTFHFKKLLHFLYRVEKYETTRILHESFSSIMENYLMIVILDSQCKSPYFTGYFYFPLRKIVGLFV